METLFTFDFMKETTELNKRHLASVQLLQKAANPKTFKYGLMVCAEKIAVKLNISPQTVVNYLSGRVKDGYLTEAITKEFKTLHIETN